MNKQNMVQQNRVVHTINTINNNTSIYYCFIAIGRATGTRRVPGVGTLLYGFGRWWFGRAPFLGCGANCMRRGSCGIARFHPRDARPVFRSGMICTHSRSTRSNAHTMYNSPIM